MRLKFVAAFLVGDQEFAEVAVGAVLIAEKVGDKFGGGGHEVVPRRAVDGQGAFAVFEPGGLNKRGEITAVVDMKVREENYVELGHLRPAFAETKGTATAGIDEHAGAAVLPDEIAARGALVLQFRTAGAEDLGSYAASTAGLGGRRFRKRKEQEKSWKPKEGWKG